MAPSGAIVASRSGPSAVKAQSPMLLVKRNPRNERQIRAYSTTVRVMFRDFGSQVPVTTAAFPYPARRS
jgi:hypothetical protein